MWKCSNCGTDNEYNFCTNCQMSRTENEVWQFVDEEMTSQPPMPKQVEEQPPIPEQMEEQPPMPEQVEVQSPMPEQVEVQSPMPEQVEEQPPMPEQVEEQSPMSGQGEEKSPTPEASAHQPVEDEKSGKKGLIVGIVVVVAVIALLIGLVIFAMKLILDDGSGTRDPEPDTYVEEHEVEEAPGEEAQRVMIDSDGPYHLDVWGESNVMQLENSSMVLNVPLPPDTMMERVDITGSTLSLGQGEGTQWFHVWIKLRDSQLEDDFEEYSEVEVGRTLRSHGDFGEVLDYQVYEERNATLLIVHWEDEYGEGISFAKISEVGGFLLVTEIGFESLENRRDFFEAYGFNDYFKSVIQGVVAEWGADGAGTSNQDQDEDRNGEELWTVEQVDSRLDLEAEFWEVSDSSFDLFFFVWDYVIFNNTILEQYPNADVERLTRLYTEFDDCFDELNIFPLIEIDDTLPYDSEHNQNVFQETRELIQEFERIYSDFRAALEGR